MKTLLIALTLVAFTEAASAQKEVLAFDEQNQYIYYQVVDMPAYSADTLYTRGLNFLKSMDPKLKIKPASTDNTKMLSGQGKFVTQGGISVVKHANGEIAYRINIECKDGKYRYWLAGFTFTPYQRDRYGNFVPQQGIDIPLETASSRFNKKDADNYLDQTGAFCKDAGEKLKVYMLKISTVKKAVETKKISTKDW